MGSGSQGEAMECPGDAPIMPDGQPTWRQSPLTVWEVLASKLWNMCPIDPPSGLLSLILTLPKWTSFWKKGLVF